MGRKGEFLSNKANVLVHVLHDRGWEITVEMLEDIIKEIKAMGEEE